MPSIRKKLKYCLGSIIKQKIQVERVCCYCPDVQAVCLGYRSEAAALEHSPKGQEPAGMEECSTL